ncbi:hypothetical protein [Amycolatopsis sp. NBC_00438]|uniref:hypothetical protein n=1 Tax=Amycolatopsis sp. NBC_00438 TaxID=2903558 RepID=UPI002E2145D8
MDAHFLDGGGRGPSHEELVGMLTSELHRSQGGNGYVALRVSAAERSIAQFRTAQIALVQAIWEEMLRRQLTHHSRKDVRLNMFEANDGSLPKEIVGDVSTFKRLHFDPYSIFFAHLYEPPKNLTGGRISLVDVHGYLGRNGLNLLDVFEPLHLPGHNGRLVARREHRLRMLEEHAHHVDPPAEGELLLVIVRNDPIVGVAHEIEKIRPLSSTEPIARRFFRTSMAPHH